METMTEKATEQADGAGSGVRAALTRDAQKFLRTSSIDDVAEELVRLKRENYELRAVVKAQTPLMDILTFDASEHLSALLSSALALEARGDHCHLRLQRDGDAKIVAAVLCVEDR